MRLAPRYCADCNGIGPVLTRVNITAYIASKNPQAAAVRQTARAN